MFRSTDSCILKPQRHPVIAMEGDGAVLFNERHTAEQRVAVQQALLQLPGLQGHIWIASSGTTQSPHTQKWVALRRCALLSSAAAVNRHLRVDAADRWLSPLPPFHVGGLGIQLRSYLADIPWYDFYGAGRWQAAAFREALQRYHITLSALVPAQVFDLVKEALSPPPSLRAVIVGGGALPDALWSAARRLGWPLLPSYGMTEASSQVATAPLDALQGEGPPAMALLDHLDARVDDEGVLWLRGDALLTAYVLCDGAQPTVYTPLVDGWLRCHDRAFVDADSRRLTFLGRCGDVVKILGENVCMATVAALWQEALLAAAYGGDSAVVAVADARRGHSLTLYATRDDAALRAAMRHFNARALPFLHLKEPQLVDALPRSPLGKLLTNAL